MKIFTDTNVLVSAFTARGLCADLLEIILADHQLVTGEIVLNELERVLIKKTQRSTKESYPNTSISSKTSNRTDS